jgi:L-Ala-D/L-Glu epimerase
MNRRDWLRIIGATGIAASFPTAPAIASTENASSQPPSLVKVDLKRLNLQQTWTTTMSSSTYRETVNVTYARNGLTGHGEGAPIVRYKEFPAEARQAIEANLDDIAAGDPAFFESFLADTRKKLGDHQRAAMAAVDIAVMDWVCQRLNIPLYAYFGLNPSATPLTTFSIGIDTPEITKQKTIAAADYPVLKVKVGLKMDEETITAIRSVTKKPLRVDANEGWTDKEEAIRKINWLETQGVEFIEQPMPAHMFEETNTCAAKSTFLSWPMKPAPALLPFRS